MFWNVVEIFYCSDNLADITKRQTRSDSLEVIGSFHKSTCFTSELWQPGRKSTHTNKEVADDSFIHVVFIQVYKLFI